MSQIFDYFACSRSQIEVWIEAVELSDERRQLEIENAMPAFISLKNLGIDDVNLLVHCGDKDPIDIVKAVGEIDLVKELGEAGPWVLAFRDPQIVALATMTLDEPTLARWTKAVADYRGIDQTECRELLTAAHAKDIKRLCEVAVEKRLGLFACFFG
jgi:hypothetical protein